MDEFGDADAAVLWMHGLGADGHDFESIVPELRLPHSMRVRFIFPHAPMIPVSLNFGSVMRAWYDLKGDDLRRMTHDPEGIRASASALEALLAREKSRGIPAERIVVAGFSQGGAMAMHVGLRHAERLAGIVAMSAFLVLPETLAAEASPANRKTPIFVAHGTMDPMVPESAGRLTKDTLRAAGYDVAYLTYPMQHQVCLEECHALGAFLTKQLGRQS